MKDSRGAIQDFNRAGKKQENILRSNSEFQCTIRFKISVLSELFSRRHLFTMTDRRVGGGVH